MVSQHLIGVWDINFQWRGFWFNNDTKSTSKVIQYTITFNTIYFIITNNISTDANRNDTDGFSGTNGFCSNSSLIANINSEIWITNYESTMYSDIFALGI